MTAKKVVVLVLVVGLMMSSAVAGYAMDQPRMMAALDHLRAARAELERASHNKGGHRVEAIKMIDRAIVQVQKGMEAGEIRR